MYMYSFIVCSFIIISYYHRFYIKNNKKFGKLEILNTLQPCKVFNFCVLVFGISKEEKKIFR